MRVVFVHGACVRDGSWWWHRTAELLAERGVRAWPRRCPAAARPAARGRRRAGAGRGRRRGAAGAAGRRRADRRGGAQLRRDRHRRGGGGDRVGPPPGAGLQLPARGRAEPVGLRRRRRPGAVPRRRPRRRDFRGPPGAARGHVPAGLRRRGPGAGGAEHLAAQSVRVTGQPVGAAAWQQCPRRTGLHRGPRHAGGAAARVRPPGRHRRRARRRHHCSCRSPTRCGTCCWRSEPATVSPAGPGRPAPALRSGPAPSHGRTPPRTRSRRAPRAPHRGPPGRPARWGRRRRAARRRRPAAPRRHGPVQREGEPRDGHGDQGGDREVAALDGGRVGDRQPAARVGQVAGGEGQPGAGQVHDRGAVRDLAEPAARAVQPHVGRPL